MPRRLALLACAAVGVPYGVAVREESPVLRRLGPVPQLNWSVAGPLVVILSLIVGLSGFVVSYTGTGIGGSDDRPVSAARNLGASGTGGGVDLRPPELVKSQIFSLSARVAGSPTIRRGPGTQYAPVAKATEGQEVHVIACSPNCDWLRVFSLNDEGQWWLPAAFLVVSGKVDELPVLTPAEVTSGR